MDRVFLGAGRIGAGMIQAARSRGEVVRCWNRTGSKAREVAQATGAIATNGLAEAVAGAPLVHLALAADEAVDQVLGSILPHLAPGAIVVDHTTASPRGTAARAGRMAHEGVAFLHAPVFMSPAGCRAMAGVMVVAGPQGAWRQAQPALSAMTGEAWYVGERADLAAITKLAGNALIVSVVAGLADVLGILRAQDVPPEHALALLSHFNPAGVLSYRGPTMVSGDHRTSWALTMARKDVGLMVDAADGSPLALLPALLARMDVLIAQGHGALDLAALAVDHVPTTQRDA